MLQERGLVSLAGFLRLGGAAFLASALIVAAWV